MAYPPRRKLSKEQMEAQNKLQDDPSAAMNQAMVKYQSKAGAKGYGQTPARRKAPQYATPKPRRRKKEPASPPAARAAAASNMLKSYASRPQR